MLITLPFTRQNGKALSGRNAAAPFLAAPICIAGYYLAEGLIFGSFASAAASAVGNVILLGSAVIFLVAAKALDRLPEIYHER